MGFSISNFFMKKILVGLSWWVDSAVTAYLLQQEWYEVTAGFMINYLAEDGNCPTSYDLEEAKKVADFLGINFFSFDYQDEYYNKIVEYIFEGYKQWYTPNPDILCNSEIKFKLFLEEAMNLWFDGIATGHYARIMRGDGGYFHLLKWVDANKDQTYFLAWLEQWQLARTLFPIWWMQKQQVRNKAREIGLPNAERKDSQWICFIWKVDMHKFLRQKLPVKKWKAVDTSGNQVAEHDGAWFYTIWQRRGLGISLGKPVYVVDKDVENNIIVIGEQKDLNLYSSELTTTNWHWLANPKDFPLEWKAKIRYPQEDQNCTIYPEWNWIKALFENPQRAIASWQTFAFYQWDELVGSWTIR